MKQRKHHPARNVRGRVLLINGAFLLGTALALGAAFFLQTRATLRREFEKRGLALTELVASATWMTLVHEDSTGVEGDSRAPVHRHGAIDRLTDQLSAVVRDEDVRYVLVLDADGGTLAFTSSPGVSRESALAEIGPSGVRAPEYRWAKRGRDGLHAFETPVCEGHHPPIDLDTIHQTGHQSCRHIATVWVGLSPERTMAQVDRALWTSLLAALVIAAIGLTVVLVMTRWILKPLIAMAEAARAVARGELGRRVEVESDDEIGDLARAFNEMTWSLNDSQAELARRNDELQLVAAEKERLYQNAQSRATRLEVMNELAKGIASSLNPEQIFQHVHRQLSRLLTYEYLSVERWIPEMRRLRRDAFWMDRPQDGIETNQLIDIDGTPIRKVQQSRMPLSIPDLEREPSMAQGLLVRAGLSSGFIVPIIAGEEFLGILSLASRRRNAFARVEVATVFAVADTLAVVLKNVDLYRRLEESYADLQETQKRLARSESVRRAEKLRSVGQMASGIAHNFNNVLSAVIGRVQILKMNAAQGELDPEVVLRYLEVIERASLDGSDTVRRLQEFSRGQREAEVERADLNDIIHGVIEITRPRWKDQAEQQGIHIRIETLLERVPAVACIPGEVREALTNLVFNAVDAMPGGGTLTIKTRPDGNVVALTVRDTGVGMSTEVRERAFDPFFSTKGVQGTGLGLSTVFGIVERHRGTIRLTSEPGEGTEFEIRLPVAKSSTREAHHDDLMSSRPWAILVGDDEPNVREATADLLRLLGHTVTLAANGEETVVRFRSGHFDAVFTDLGMPDMSGWEVAAAIRETDPDVPIVLATGWGAEIDEDTARSRGITRVLAKPFTVQKLSSLVAELQTLRRAA